MTVIIEVKQKKNHKTRLKQLNNGLKTFTSPKNYNNALSFIVFSAHVSVLISTRKNHLGKKKITCPCKRTKQYK